MTEKEKLFLINYMAGRAVSWHIDPPVAERYPNLSKDIADLQADGFIKIAGNKYMLTELGEAARKAFRLSEKERRAAMHSDIYRSALHKDHLSAYNCRASYERESVLPHGIQIGEDGSPWPKEQQLPQQVARAIENSRQLDFTDCQNSEAFREALRNLDTGNHIAGIRPNDPTLYRILIHLEENLGESLICPALDRQLSQKCVRPNPPRLYLYFNTKVIVRNFISIGMMEKWDGNFNLGTYDCTNPFHFSMAEFEAYQQLAIPGFPKTFQTYDKHKRANSEKYQAWMSFVGDRKLTKPS